MSTPGRRKAVRGGPGGFVLTLQVRARDADAIGERVRKAWGLEPVQISRPGSSIDWIEVYFRRGEEASLAATALDGWKSVLATAVRGYRDQDWLTFWKRHFRARNVGEHLHLCPVWERHRAFGRGRTRIIINPGMSFGTGDHFTTRFCLEMIERTCVPRPPRSLLDIGTGSGVLAIAAARLGVKKVVAVDNDPLAVGQARENAKLNRLGRRIDFCVMDIVTEKPRGRFDVVCANLYGHLLVEAAPALRSLASRFVILSGIREMETDLVADAFLALKTRELVRDGDGQWSGLLLEVGC